MTGSIASASRRDALKFGVGGTAALGLLAGPVAAQTQASAKKHIVLIHGAWHGAWAWRLASPLLREAGHSVSAPTLSGLGERRNVPPQLSGLGAHVQDIVTHLEMEDLRDVVLIGHSYAGCVLSGVLAKKTGRIAHAVYLDAFVPRSGEGLATFVPPPVKAEFEKLAASDGLVPVPPPASWGERWGMTDAALIAWSEPRMAPQAARSFTETVPSDPFEALVKLTYIKCRDNPNPGFRATAEKVKADSRFTYREIA
ncbi:MAG: alpha/beta fold hydrolase, partial [Beijerinckiaceae bacterium]